MSKKLFTAWIIASMVLALFSSALTAGPVGQEKVDVSQVSMFQAKKFDAHYRAPRDIDAERMLQEEELLQPGARPEVRRAAIQDFMSEFTKRNPDTPSPEKLRNLLQNEKKQGKKKGQITPESPIKSLVVPVEFPNTSTFEWCTEEEGGGVFTFTGPLHNQVPAPGPRDNNSLWYDNTTPELYNELYFGQGPNAGVIIHHPNLGTIDMRGSTMANYYLEQSEGKFLPAGMIYPKWLQASQAEAYYGQDSCDGGSHNTKAHELVKETLDAVMADDPNFNWQSFDGDGNGVVDNFTVIHAGEGQEGGGGLQGDWSIWSHASLIDWPNGYQVCVKGSVGCPDRDIFVREYSMDPEMVDVGVISEEFGHAAFGLPDLYTTDAQASISNWAIMESGSWNGPVGGMQPAPFPLWFRYILGWAQPTEVDYTGAGQFKVGQLSLRPTGTAYGIKINMPAKTVNIDNPLNSGKAWWSDVGNRLVNTITHEFNLAGTANPVFSFNSHWAIEADWDAGYVEVSTDGGATWVALDDMGDYFTQSTLNGNNAEGKWNLSGFGEDVLSFDLAAYAGQTVQIRLSYVTDTAAMEAGWWADDFSVVDGATTLFSDDVEGASTWMAAGWQVVPLVREFPRFYLVEWRNNSGFDRGLKYPYSTVYNDADEWQVDRAPYTVPGMLVYFRDASYDLDYTLLDSLYDAPSYGPKHALGLVDSHFFPLTYDTNRSATTGAYPRANARVQPANAAFTLQPTTPFTLHQVDANYNILEEKTFGPQKGISQFHDSLGYYPGLFLGLNGRLYFREANASMALPAKGNYTTRITDPLHNPLPELYGLDLGDTILGTGNPGDDGVQYGLHLAILDKAKDGSWGLIKMWNSPALVEVTKTVNVSEAKAGNLLKYTIKIKNLTPVKQPVTVIDPMPAGLTFKAPAPLFDATNNQILWQIVVPANGTKTVTYVVKVNTNVPAGTVITNEAFVTDDALGGSASVNVTIK